MSDAERVKLEAGLTDEFTGEQIQALLDEDGTVLLAAAHACEILAARYSKAVDITMDGQSLKRSQMAGAFAVQAARLRERAGVTTGGVGTIGINARL